MALIASLTCAIGYLWLELRSRVRRSLLLDLGLALSWAGWMLPIVGLQPLWPLLVVALPVAWALDRRRSFDALGSVGVRAAGARAAMGAVAGAVRRDVGGLSVETWLGVLGPGATRRTRR